ncbi:MAG: HAMP domain-containing sensor histidine kinase, partial [Bacteroidota bacterium]
QVILDRFLKPGATVATVAADVESPAFITIASALGLGFLFCSRQEQINTHRIMRTKTYAAAFGHDMLNIFQSPQSTIDFAITAYKKEKKELVTRKDWENMEHYMKECRTQACAFKKLVKFDYIPQEEMQIKSVSALMKTAYNLIPSYIRDRVRIEEKQKDFMVEVFPPFVNNIILNLTKNALVHGNASEIVLSWEPSTRRLYVKDNGIGISSETEQKVKDLYASAGPQGTGDGIGLAFIFMVVEDIFKARIDFHSSNNGTTFWIEFPKIVK